MKYLIVLLLLIPTYTLCAEQAGGNMQEKQRLVLVKQQIGSTSIKVGLTTVPEFFEGSLESYCLELANKISSTTSLVTFKPIKGGKEFTVVSLNSGNVSFVPLTDESGIADNQLLETFIKAD